MNWIYFPKTEEAPKHLKKIVAAFEKNSKKINSKNNDHSNEARLSSDEVLKILESDFVDLGYSVEKSKQAKDKIRIPVLYGTSGKEELAFEADGYSEKLKTVIEIEAGRAVTNYQFLKDIFQASMMVSTEYLVLSVREVYRNSNDFDKVKDFLDSIFLTNKIKLDLKGILLIGY